MPKFRSINELVGDAVATARRFPMVLVFAAIGTVAMIQYTNFDFPAQRMGMELINLSLIAAIGLTSFLSLRVFAETHGWSRQQELLWSLALTAVLVAYYYMLPKHLKGIDINRYCLINANLHLLCAIAPFLFIAGRINAFWQYNKALFIRIIISFIYSNTIYVGLIIAIAVTDHLFEFIKFDRHIYSQLWFIVVGMFNTWFFLKGVPRPILDLESEQGYPKGLRIFTQFILIPLAVLYIAILYMYMSKIVVTWTLPDGWLSSFIIGVSIMGIVTLLLVHPLRDSEEFGWIRVYSRYFYLALFPLIVLMAVAIGRRIADYGITEQRYFVLLFTVWLFVVAARFTFKPRADIRFIPITLFVLVVAATWGPWSALSVAKNSQIGRLEKLLTDNGLLKDGVLKKATDPKQVNVEATREIGNIVAYLDSSFGLRDLEKWAPPEVSVFWKDLPANRFVVDELGLDYTGYYYNRRGGFEAPLSSTYWSTLHEPTVPVTGYDYFVQLQLYNLNNNVNSVAQRIKLPAGEATLTYNSTTGELVLGYQEQRLVLGILNAAWLNSMRQRFGTNNYNLPVDAMTFQAEDGPLRALIRINNLNSQMPRNDTEQINSIYGHLLISVE